MSDAVIDKVLLNIKELNKAVIKCGSTKCGDHSCNATEQQHVTNLIGHLQLHPVI